MKGLSDSPQQFVPKRAVIVALLLHGIVRIARVKGVYVFKYSMTNQSVSSHPMIKIVFVVEDANIIMCRRYIMTIELTAQHLRHLFDGFNDP
ncbi:unnamed protein product [Strongylus vulgaris]|uniref:Uncharacterized protein n=1 Tax=Strongylus vulgaris TaxID=40348 RepID=A0A3P7LCL5_STRVU|nr:unnamed protein product [Strongylus vulgaris]